MDFIKYDFFKPKPQLIAEAKEGLKGNSHSQLINFIFWISKLMFIAGLTLFIVFLAKIKTSNITLLILSIIFLFISLFTYGPLKVSVAKNAMNMVEDTSPSKKDLGYGFKHKYFRNVWYGLVLFFRYIFFLALLVFPFFIKYLDYSVSAFVLAKDDKISVSQALKHSTLISKGRKKTLLQIIFGFWPKYLLCLISLYIYSIRLRPLFNATVYAYFKDINE